MDKGQWIVENWYLLAAGIAAAAAACFAVLRFFQLPSAAQAAKVKEWLLWAVIQAEKELGSGTGQVKLRQVYDLFVQRFPAVAAAVSFDTFGGWVDEALEEMREMLKQNRAVKELVEGEEK